MTSINPQNYPGAAVTIVGWVANDLRNPLYDKEGTRGVKEFSIPVNEGYKNRDTGDWVETGTTWYSYTAAGTGVDMLTDLGIRKGLKIRIDGAKQEVREYTAKDGAEKLGINLSFGTITVLDEGNAEPLEDDDSDDDPFA